MMKYLYRHAAALVAAFLLAVPALAQNSGTATTTGTIAAKVLAAGTNWPVEWLEVCGYYACNDGGQGLFHREACTNDGGACITDSAGHTFRRQNLNGDLAQYGLTLNSIYDARTCEADHSTCQGARAIVLAAIAAAQASHIVTVSAHGIPFVINNGDLTIPAGITLDCGGSLPGSALQLGTDATPYYAMGGFIWMNPTYKPIVLGQIKNCNIMPTWYTSTLAASITTTRLLVDDYDHAKTGTGLYLTGDSVHAEGIFVAGFDTCIEATASPRGLLRNYQADCNVNVWNHNQAGGFKIENGQNLSYVESNFKPSGTNIKQQNNKITAIGDDGTGKVLITYAGTDQLVVGDHVFVTGLNDNTHLSYTGDLTNNSNILTNVVSKDDLSNVIRIGDSVTGTCLSGATVTDISSAAGAGDTDVSDAVTVTLSVNASCTATGEALTFIPASSTAPPGLNGFFAVESKPGANQAVITASWSGPTATGAWVSGSNVIKVDSTLNIGVGQYVSTGACATPGLCVAPTGFATVPQVLAVDRAHKAVIVSVSATSTQTGQTVHFANDTTVSGAVLGQVTLTTAYHYWTANTAAGTGPEGNGAACTPTGSPWLGNCRATVMLFTDKAAGTAIETAHMHGWSQYLRLDNAQETFAHNVICDSGQTSALLDQNAVGIFITGNGDKISIDSGKCASNSVLVNNPTQPGSGVSVTGTNFRAADTGLFVSNSGALSLTGVHGSSDGMIYLDSGQKSFSSASTVLTNATFGYDDPANATTTHCDASSVFADNWCPNSAGANPSANGNPAVQDIVGVPLSGVIADLTYGTGPATSISGTTIVLPNAIPASAVGKRISFVGPSGPVNTTIATADGSTTITTANAPGFTPTYYATGVAIVNGGSGYTKGDTISTTDGTTMTVIAVSTGVVTDLRVATQAANPSGASGLATTGGTGTGLTVTYTRNSTGQYAWGTDSGAAANAVLASIAAAKKNATVRICDLLTTIPIQVPRGITVECTGSGRLESPGIMLAASGASVLDFIGTGTNFGGGAKNLAVDGFGNATDPILTESGERRVFANTCTYQGTQSYWHTTGGGNYYTNVCGQNDPVWFPVAGQVPSYGIMVEAADDKWTGVTVSGESVAGIYGNTNGTQMSNVHVFGNPTFNTPVDCYRIGYKMFFSNIKCDGSSQAFLHIVNSSASGPVISGAYAHWAHRIPGSAAMALVDNGVNDCSISGVLYDDATTAVSHAGTDTCTISYTDTNGQKWDEASNSVRMQLNNTAGAKFTVGTATAGFTPGGTVTAVDTTGTATRFTGASVGNNAAFSGSRYDGTAASPTAVQSGEKVAEFNGKAYDGTSSATVIGGVRVYAAENQSPTAAGSKTCLFTNPNTTTTNTDSLCQQNSGGVTVGSPTGGDEGAGTVNAPGIFINGVSAGSGSVTPADFGSVGTADDTVAVQAAINSGKPVRLERMYLVNGTLTFPSGAVIFGKDPYLTGFKLKSGATCTASCDVLETAGFYSLIGTNSLAGTAGATFFNFTIDGNSANNTATDPDKANGIAWYGWQPIFSNIHIHDVIGHGIRSEWGPSGRQVGSGPVGGNWDTVSIDSTGRNGVWFKGPHDTKTHDLVTLDAGLEADNTYCGELQETGNATEIIQGFHASESSASTNRPKAAFCSQGGNHISDSEFEGGREQFIENGQKDTVSNSSFYGPFGASNTALLDLQNNANTFTGNLFLVTAGQAYYAVNFGNSAAANLLSANHYVGFQTNSPFNFTSDGGSNYIQGTGNTTAGGATSFGGTAAASDTIDYCQTGTVICTHQIGGGSLDISGGVYQSGLQLAHFPLPQGRLTLQSGSTVMTADQTAVTSIYYLPYAGNQVPVGNATGGVDVLTFSSQQSLGLDAVTPHIASGSLYDVFAINNSGSIALCAGPAWTSTTGRGTGAGTTELVLLYGVWMNANALTHCWGGASGTTDYGSVGVDQATYLGTFSATANGQTQFVFKGTAANGGSNGYLGLFNAYNRVRVTCQSADNTTAWTYNVATWRAADNSTSNRCTWVDGLQKSEVNALLSESLAGTSTIARIGLNLDATTGQPSPYFCSDSSTANITISCAYSTPIPQLGLHYIQAMEEAATAANATFNSNSTAAYMRMESEY